MKETTMKKTIKLTESDLIKIVKKVINEESEPPRWAKEFMRYREEVFDKESIENILNYIKPFLESGCVKYGFMDNKLLVGLESKDCFIENNFHKSEKARIQSMLWNKRFNIFHNDLDSEYIIYSKPVPENYIN